MKSDAGQDFVPAEEVEVLKSELNSATGILLWFRENGHIEFWEDKEKRDLANGAIDEWLKKRGGLFVPAEEVATLRKDLAEAEHEVDALAKWGDKHGTKGEHSVWETLDNMVAERDSLRSQLTALQGELAKARDAALEEALKPCEEFIFHASEQFNDGRQYCAHAIRQLKTGKE